MFKKAAFLTFCFSVVLNTHLHAGWPEDGWEGVHSLRVVHKGQTVNFDELHQHLATEEEKITRVLSPNDPKNIVLASISFLGGEVPSLHTYPLKSHDDKWLVFESGWASSFIPHPVYDQAQRLIKPYAAKLQNEDLTLVDKEQLVDDCNKVAEGQRYFEDQVRPRFHFFDQNPLPIEYILERVAGVFAEVDPSEGSYAVFKELEKDRNAVSYVKSILQTTQLEAAQRISALSQKIDFLSGVSLELIKELAAITKSIQEKLFKQERELLNIGSKVISTYWHSEQNF